MHSEYEINQPSIQAHSILPCDSTALMVPCPIVHYHEAVYAFWHWSNWSIFCTTHMKAATRNHSTSCARDVDTAQQLDDIVSKQQIKAQQLLGHYQNIHFNRASGLCSDPNQDLPKTPEAKCFSSLYRDLPWVSLLSLTLMYVKIFTFTCIISTGPLSKNHTAPAPKKTVSNF